MTNKSKLIDFKSRTVLIRILIIAIVAVAAIVTSVLYYNKKNDHSMCGTKIWIDNKGAKHEEHICNKK